MLLFSDLEESCAELFLWYDSISKEKDYLRYLPNLKSEGATLSETCYISATNVTNSCNVFTTL